VVIINRDPQGGAALARNLLALAQHTEPGRVDDRIFDGNDQHGSSTPSPSLEENS
jgi:hypothetical protein